MPLLSLIGVLLYCLPAHGATHTVPVQFPTIQSAVDASSGGDTILVAHGTYNEAVRIQQGLTLLGGWNNEFTVRDTDQWTTTVDGEGLESACFQCRGQEGDHVTIDGFTLRNAWFDIGNGGGVLVMGKLSSTITNNRFYNNYARFHGGGVCLMHGASGEIRNNLFDGNSAVFHGGGIGMIDNAVAEITGNIFRNNLVVFDSGGGIAMLKFSKGVIRGNTFVENKAMMRGGAVSFLQGVEVELDRNLMIYNDCGYKGGAIYSWKSSPRIIRNTLVRNYSALTGGIRIDEEGETRIEGNLIVRTSGPWFYRDGESAIETRRNILFGAGEAEGALDDVQATWADPLLCDEQNDQRLRPGSPCAGETPVGCYSVSCGEDPPSGEPALVQTGGQ